MVPKRCKEVKLAAENKKLNLVHNIRNIDDHKLEYFIETHKRLQTAKCYFCKTTVEINNNFEKRAKLISKIGDKMNVCQKSGFITSNCNVYYYETEWIDKNHYFKFYLDYVCLETEIYQ